MKHKFEGKPAIVSQKTTEDLIRVYFDPHNFRKNKKGHWVFDCSKYIAALPTWVGGRKIEVSDDPHPDTGKITDSIVNEQNWYSINEWVKKSEWPRQLIMRIWE